MRAVVLAIVPVLAAIFTSCSTEGDALLRIARDGAVAETAPIDAGPDTRELRCGKGDACVPANGEQCCAYLLAYFCTEVGTCEGGPIPCDQPGHCATGQRCCGQPGAFLIQTQCQSVTCGQYEMCVRDGDCPAGKRCTGTAGAYSICN